MLHQKGPSNPNLKICRKKVEKKEKYDIVYNKIKKSSKHYCYLQFTGTPRSLTPMMLIYIKQKEQ